MARFPTTQWSLVGAAAQPDPELRREVLGHLLGRYLPAMRAHLVLQKQIDPEAADDLLQGFVARKVLEQHILTKVVPGKGKFRTWLLTALDRYVISERRYATAARRSEERTTSLAAIGQEPAAAGGSDVFDQAWARELLAEALCRMHEECESTQRPDLWGTFESRVLGPTLGDAPPLPYEQLVERFGYASPVQASNALITAKRMFARLLRAVIAEYAPDESAVEEEFRDLRRILAGSAE